MMQSFSLEEIERKEIEQQIVGRKIIDQLHQYYRENSFDDFEIKQTENVYCLQSADVVYIFETKKSNEFSCTLTVLKKNSHKLILRNKDIMEERYINGSLKPSIDEFFIYLEKAFLDRAQTT